MPSKRFRLKLENMAAKIELNMLRRGKVKEIPSNGPKSKLSELDFANDISSQEGKLSASRPSSKKLTLPVMSSAKVVSRKSLASEIANLELVKARSASKSDRLSSGSDRKSSSNHVTQLPVLLSQVARKLKKNDRKADVKRLRGKQDSKLSLSRKEKNSKNSSSENNSTIVVDVLAQSKSPDTNIPFSKNSKASKAEKAATRSLSRKSKTKSPQRVKSKTRTAKSVSPRRSRGRALEIADTNSSKVIRGIRSRSLSGGPIVSNSRKLTNIPSEYRSRIPQGRKIAQYQHPHSSSSDRRPYANSKKRELSFSETKSNNSSKRRKTCNESFEHKRTNLVKSVISKSNKKSEVKLKTDFSFETNTRSISNKEANEFSGTQRKTGSNDRSVKISPRKSLGQNSSVRSIRTSNRSYSQGDNQTTGKKQTPSSKAPNTRPFYGRMNNFETSSSDKIKEQLKGRHSRSSGSDILKLSSDLQIISTHLKEASKKRLSLKVIDITDSKKRIRKSSSAKSKNYDQTTLHHTNKVGTSGEAKLTAAYNQIRKSTRTYLKMMTPAKGQMITVTSAVKEKEREARNASTTAEEAINEVNSRKYNLKRKRIPSAKNLAARSKDYSISNKYLGKMKISKKNISLAKNVHSNKTQKRYLRHQSNIDYITEKSANSGDGLSFNVDSEVRLFNSKKSRSRRDFIRKKTADKFLSFHKVKFAHKKKTPESSISRAGELPDDKPVTETRTSARKSNGDNAQAKPTKVLSHTPKTTSVIKPPRETSTHSPNSDKKSSQNKRVVGAKVLFPDSARSTRSNSASFVSKSKFVSDVKPVNGSSHPSPKTGLGLPLTGTKITEPAKSRSKSSSVIRNSNRFSTSKKVTERSSLSKASTRVHQSTLGLHQTTRDLRQSTFDEHQSSHDLHRSTHDLHQSSHGLHRSTHDLHQSSHGLHQSSHGLHRVTRDPRLQSDTIFHKQAEKESPKTSTKSSTVEKSQKAGEPRLAPSARKEVEGCRKSLFNSPRKNIGKKGITISPKIATFEEAFQNIISPSLRKTFKHKYVQVSSIPSLLNIQKLVSKLPNCVRILTQVRDALNKADGDICTFTEIISIDDLLATANRSVENDAPCDVHALCDSPSDDDSSTESRILHQLRLKSGKIVTMVDKKVSYSPSWSKGHNRRKRIESLRRYKLPPAMSNTTTEASRETASFEVSNVDDECDELTFEDGYEGGNEVQADESDNEIVFKLNKTASPKEADELNKSVFTQTIEVEIKEIEPSQEPVSGNKVEVVKDISNTENIIRGNFGTETISLSEEVPKTNVQDLISKNISPLKKAANKSLSEDVACSKEDKPSNDTKGNINVDSQDITESSHNFESDSSDWLQPQVSASKRNTLLGADKKNKQPKIPKFPKLKKLKTMSKSKKKMKPIRRKKHSPVITVHRIRKEELPYVFEPSTEYSETDSEDDAENESNDCDINNSDIVDKGRFKGIDTLDCADENDLFLLSDVKNKSRDNMKSPNRSTNSTEYIKQQTTDPFESSSGSVDILSTRSSFRDSVTLKSAKENERHLENEREATQQSLRQFTSALELISLAEKDDLSRSQNESISPKRRLRKSARNFKSELGVNVYQRSTSPSMSESKISSKANLEEHYLKGISQSLDKKTTTEKLSSPIKMQNNIRVSRHNASVDTANQSRDINMKRSKSLSAINETTSYKNKLALTPENNLNVSNVNKVSIENINAANDIPKLSMSVKRNLRKTIAVSSNIAMGTSLPPFDTTPKTSIQGYVYFSKSSPRKRPDVSNHKKISAMMLNKFARTTRSSKKLAGIAYLPRDASRDVSISMESRPTIKGLKTKQATKSHKGNTADEKNKYRISEPKKKSLTQTKNLNKATAKKYELEENTKTVSRLLRKARPSVKLGNVDLYLSASLNNTNAKDVEMLSDSDDSDVTKTDNLPMQSPSKQKVRNKRKRISLVLSQQNYFNLKGYRRGRYLLRARRKKANADSPNSKNKGSNLLITEADMLQSTSKHQKSQDIDTKTKSRYSSEFLKINSPNSNKEKPKPKENNTLSSTAETPRKANISYLKTSPEASKGKKYLKYQKISSGKLTDSSCLVEIKSMRTPEKLSPFVKSVGRKSFQMTNTKPTGKATNIKESFSNKEHFKISSKGNKSVEDIVEKVKKFKESKSHKRLQRNTGLDEKLKQAILQPVSILGSSPNKSLTKATDTAQSTSSMRKSAKTIQLHDLTSTKNREKKKRLKPNSEKSHNHSPSKLPVFIITEPTPLKRRVVSRSSMGIKPREADRIFSMRPVSTSSESDSDVINSYSITSPPREHSRSFSYVRRHSTHWNDDWTPSSEYGRRMLRVLDRKSVLASPIRRTVEGSVLSSTNLADDSNISEYNNAYFEDSFGSFMNTSRSNRPFTESSLQKNDYSHQHEQKAALKNYRFKFNPSDSCIIL